MRVRAIPGRLGARSSFRWTTRRLALAVLTLGALAATLSCGSDQPTGPGSDQPKDPVTDNPVIGMSVTSLTFTAQQGAAGPAAQTVSITNTGTGTLSGLGASVSYSSGSGWLQVTLSSTTAPSTLTAQLITGSLPAGTHTATVSVTSGVAANSPQTVSVTCTVAAVGPPPAIALSPTSLSFSAVRGLGNPASKTVSVTNAGGGTLTGLGASVSYGTGSGWLQVSLNSTTAPATLTVQPITGSLSAGTYAATVSVTSGTASNSPQDVAVTFTVTLPAGPVLQTPTVNGTTISLTWTYSWPQFASSNDAYLLEESTTSSTSGFTLIETLSGVYGQSPYTHQLTRTPGTYWYRVRAWSAYGRTAYSQVGSATVTAPSQIQTYASYDNAVAANSLDPSVANTVYQAGPIGVGGMYVAALPSGWNSLCYASALKFDVQQDIAGRSIKSATLRLHVDQLRGDFSVTPQMELSAFGQNWNPATLTWNVMAGMQFYTAGWVVKSAPSTGAVPVDFDVTTIVSNWASGWFGNYGFALVPSNSYYPGWSSVQFTTFQSLEYWWVWGERPLLIIEFN